MTHVVIKSYRKERESEIMRGLTKALEQVGALVERQAKINTGGTTKHPYRKSGNLVSSIIHELSDDGFSVQIGSTISSPPYPTYLELGTVNMPPYPWLFPAVEMNRDNIARLLKNVK